MPTKFFFLILISICLLLCLCMMVTFIVESNTEKYEIFHLIDTSVRKGIARHVLLNNHDFTSRRTDGIGSQLRSIMYSIMWAHKSDWNFYYLPMHHMTSWDITAHHMLAGQTHAISDWLNMGFGEKTYEECAFCLIGEPTNFWPMSPDINWLFDTEGRNLLKAKYYQNKVNISSLFSNDSFNVAVHVRRGDVEDLNISARLSSDSHYIKAMDDIFELVNDHRVRFYIFSDSEQPFSHKVYSKNGKYDVTFYLNEDWTKTFHAFVVADALIMSKSTMSWTAAVLSNSSYIYYTPNHLFQSPPLKHWFLNWELKDGVDQTRDKWLWWMKRNCSVFENEYNAHLVSHRWRIGKYYNDTSCDTKHGGDWSC